LFAVAGAVLALRDAGISSEEFNRNQCAIVSGSSLMDFSTIGNSIEAVHRRGARAAQPRLVYTANVTGPQEAIGQALGSSARTMSLQSACCSGLDAVGYAANLIATGAAEIALCGGTETPLSRFPMLEFRNAELTPATSEMPERMARPFDLWRTTGVISEGACMFVLEPETSPRQGYSFISWYGFATDENDDLCGGMGPSARLALADAQMRPSQVDTINAWAPGHKLIDQAEFDAVSNIFPGILAEIPVVSIKGSIGMALGAAGAIQTGAAALAQRFGLLPPTVNWQYVDPSCPMNLSPSVRAVEHRVTLVNAHGLGGMNACLILEKC